MVSPLPSPELATGSPQFTALSLPLPSRLCSTLRAPLLLRWNSFALPVAAAIPVWCSQAVCRLSLLQAQGAAAALQRLYRYLAWTQ